MKGLRLIGTVLTFGVSLLGLGGCGGSPAQTQPPVAGNGILGVTELELGGSTAVAVTASAIKPQALLTVGSVELLPASFSVTDDASSPARYLNASYYIRNKSGGPLVNLTLYALSQAGKSLGGSAIKSAFNQGGSAINDGALVQELRPAHLMNSDWTVNAQGADFQAFDINEAGALQNSLRPGSGNGSIGANDVILDYGYVARSLDGNKRSIPPQAANCLLVAPPAANSCFSGKVTVAMRVPKTSALLDPYRFAMTFVLATAGGNTRVTRAREESVAEAIARAQLLTDRSNPSEIAIIGSDSVNTAGFSAKNLSNLRVSSGGGTYLPDAELWSDRFSWPTRTLPTANSDVSIPLGQKMLLDVSPPALGGLTIEGELAFAEKDLTLSSRYIMLHGKLAVGSATKPFSKRAILEFTGSDTSQNIMNMGTKGILSMGGVLELFGESNRTSWTRLGAHANKGANSISVLEANNWRVGDKIAIASTDYNSRQAEKFTISAISGNNITLNAALKYNHFGQTQSFAGKTLESRAEVALLSRNVTLRGEESSSSSTGNSSGETTFGAQIMLMSGSKARLQGIELTRVGHKNTLRRYPIHFHMLADGGDGSFIKDSSIWQSGNRCITIHGTNKLVISNNAAYDALGHCYFMEDGAETDNLLDGNLGFDTRRPADGERLLGSDENPSTFWITNPQNTLRNNVAGGAESGVGFWYAFPEHPTGLSANTSTWNRRMALGVFENNLAHSNGDTGMNVDNGPKPDGNTETTFYQPLSNPSNQDSPSVRAEWKGFMAYRNRTRGVWLRGNDLHITGALLADSAIGATFASINTSIENSVIVGETDNLGTPENWEKKGENNRSLPFPWNPGEDDPNGGYRFPIRGYEFYDGNVSAQNVTFVNFKPKTVDGSYTRPASALSYLRLDRFSIDPRNFVSGAQFINADAVYQETPANDLVNTSNNFDGSNAAVFVDKDGSVTGNAGRTVVPNNSFLTTNNCGFNSVWNSHICNERYASLSFSRTNGNELIVPVLMTRNDDSSKKVALVSYNTQPAEGDHVETSVIFGKSYTIAPQNLPNHSRLNLDSANQGDFIVTKIAWPNATVFIYRDWWIDNRNRLVAASNQADFDSSTGNKYLLSGGVLSLKLQVKNDANDPSRDWATADVCKNDLCK
jgi:cell surface hyaluronidase